MTVFTKIKKNTYWIIPVCSIYIEMQYIYIFIVYYFIYKNTHNFESTFHIVADHEGSGGTQNDSLMLYSFCINQHFISKLKLNYINSSVINYTQIH